ncbi:MAG: NAD(P)/FAD-dependent oxidoreductase [Mariprofundaceae bacterium]|nr:NAD(P)/FAD-dependent oxidoreductase [Mariprofundaceae bacterium]
MSLITKSSMFDVIILGAGAAGLMCAAEAAKRGRKVLLLDHAKKAGEKIRISGGGRCNFTNLYTTASNYISQNPHFCKSALARFTPYDTIAMLEQAGISWHEREHGQLFCDDSAKQVVDMLLRHCHQAGVNIQLDCHIEKVIQNNGFEVQSNLGTWHATALVIATGGLSIPKMGATSFGHRLAQQFGINLISTRAGLAPFRLTGQEHEQLKALAGISLPVSVSCRQKSFQEALLFTHRGMSGPAILQISSYWREGDAVEVNFLLDVNIQHYLKQQVLTRGKQTLRTVLSDILPKRLVLLWCEMYLADLPIQQLSSKQLAEIEQAIHHWSFKPAATEGYRTAEVTLGGVDTDELSSKTMQSKRINDLYFIGEVVDVTGHLGGFNFQWAWASAYAAGQAI